MIETSSSESKQFKWVKSFPAMNDSKLFFTPLKCKNFKQFIRDKNQAD